jgi:peptide/nickel transport system permease protein
MAYSVFVLLGVSLLTFLLLYMTGDPAAALLPIGTPPAQIAAFREQAGLDRPLLVQYFDYIGKAAQGDFGMSLRHRESAMGLVIERLPATLILGLAGFALTVLVATPLGLLAAIHKDGWVDYVARIVALLGQTMPSFWFAIMLILVFSVTLKWLPISGATGWKNLLLPAMALAATPIGNLTRLLRSSMVEVLSQDYVRTGRSKGLSERVINMGHALRNALIPAVTLLSIEAGYIIGGAVVIETVFAYPGMGRLAVQAITNRDITVVQSFVLLQAAIIVGINILLDVTYTIIDPRIRYG